VSARRVLVYGLGVSGYATVAHLVAEGVEVVVADDDVSAPARERAQELGVELRSAPERAALAALAQQVDEIVVSPGVPAGHPVFTLGEGGAPVVAEVELAWRRARCPIVAVTGTNGKTTVTTLVQAMLEDSGLAALAAGNIGVALLDAVDRPLDVIVAEVSSFQLAHTHAFRPTVGAWLNFSEDHLDWHHSVDDYRRAKARLWANCGPGDVAVANAEDAVVRTEVAAPRARGATVVTFGRHHGDVAWHDGVLRGGGVVLGRTSEMSRTMPHDLVDAACAAATARAAGASAEGCRRALARFRGLPHRVQLVGEANGVRFYDDSKATTPGAVLAAVSGFEHAVLIAGGRNKGLDLSVLAQAAPRLRAVLAIGEAAPEVSAAFAGITPVHQATTMADAVARAGAGAQRGDAVVLSPGCASFDWYRNYAERGDDFARCVRGLAGFVAPRPEDESAGGGDGGGARR